MQIKEGFLALAVAAALSAPAVYAQQDQTQDSAGAMDSGSAAGDQLGAGSSSGQATMDSQAQSGSDSASASSIASSADRQQSAAADSSASYDQQQASLSQPDQQSELSAGSDLAQSDVPPPVDRETVRGVQQALKDEGQDIRVDGIWGEKTHQALMEFQRQNDLDDSGQLDTETFAALNVQEQQTASADSQSSEQQTASADQQSAGADSSNSEQQSASSQ